MLTLCTKLQWVKVDGRHSHWVAPYKGVRYSLVLYCVKTEKQPLFYRSEAGRIASAPSGAGSKAVPPVARAASADALTVAHDCAGMHMPGIALRALKVPSKNVERVTSKIHINSVHTVRGILDHEEYHDRWDM